MKRCNRCGIEKKKSQFYKNNKKRDGLQVYCKVCSSAYAKVRYSSMSQTSREKILAQKNSLRVRNRQYVWDYLLEHPCVDCGEDDIVVLEFDHVDSKECQISGLLSNMASLDRIQSEIDKCEVRCANCHRRKTAIENNWHVLDYI